MTQYALLGAGISGISAAYHLQQRGHLSVTLFESANVSGGLLGNFTINGFRFDKGVHLSFTTDEYVRGHFDETPYITHRPDPYNYENGIWLKHPVQNNLFPLSPNEKVEAIKSFLERPIIADVSNYQDWLIKQYGTYIAERFPIRYTKKYWTIPADQLSLDWISNRLYQPSFDEVLFGAFTDETPTTYYAKEMRYPKYGGYISFMQPMIDKCSVMYNKRAVVIDPDKKTIEFECGERIHYEKLASSIPLPDLIRLIKDVPRRIKDAADDLWATSVALVSLGFNRPDIPKHLWFYIYDELLLSSRVNAPSLKSPNNAPQGCSSLQFEYYYSKYNPLVMNKDDLIEHTITSLVETGLATRNDISVVDCRVLPYGNVVFSHGMVARRDEVRSYLASREIATIGRFGEWDYLWSDQSFLSGKRYASSLL